MKSDGPKADDGAITLSINGEEVRVEAALHDTLLTILRDDLRLTAAKRGCNQGVCGACTVEVDGRTVRACLTLAHGCVGSDVRTLEGLGESASLRVLQDAFEHEQAFQCGFCTPGMLMSARSLLERNDRPDEAQIRTALSGNLCRCTGYVKIVSAVQSAASALRQDKGAS